jgi:hypothetical protein
MSSKCIHREAVLIFEVCNVFSVNMQLNNHPIFYYRYGTCFGPIRPSSSSLDRTVNTSFTFILCVYTIYTSIIVLNVDPDHDVLKCHMYAYISRLLFSV